MELRWTLLGLGLLLILGLYLAGKGIFRRAARVGGKAKNDATGTRTEPTLMPGDVPAGDPDVDSEPVLTERSGVGAENAAEEDQAAEPLRPRTGLGKPPEKVIIVRLMPRGGEAAGETFVLAMRKVGLEHGRYGIFHRIIDEDRENPLFSVAGLTEPGTFDLARLSSPIAGLSLFYSLPGAGDPVGRFDAMIECARQLARQLDAELYDEKGSSWSVQRERFIREEMIQYRHHMAHG